MSRDSGRRFSDVVISFLELILKKFAGSRWRPAAAVQELPRSALVYDSREERRAEEAFRILADLGFEPTRVGVACAGGDSLELSRAIALGAAGCWAAVVLDPEDEKGAKILGPAFRQFAHLHPDVVATVVGPLPSHSEILDRYRHVVTDEGGSLDGSELAAGIAHACAARVLHTTRLLGLAVTVFTILALIVGGGLAILLWYFLGR